MPKVHIKHDFLAAPNGYTVEHYKSGQELNLDDTIYDMLKGHNLFRLVEDGPDEPEIDTQDVEPKYETKVITPKKKRSKRGNNGTTSK